MRRGYLPEREYNAGMKAVILYRSKYGSTRQYAEWIAEDLGADIFSVGEFPPEKLTGYDTVIIGGYLRMGKIIGADFLISNWPVLQSKKVVLFSVAGAPANSPERARWFENTIPASIREKVTHVPLQGRAMKLSPMDRLLVSVPGMVSRLKYLLRPGTGNKPASRSFKPFDGVKRESIGPLVGSMRNLP